jgi:hypothetical protein
MLNLVALCRACEGGLGAPVWPDGGSLLDQPVKLRNAFNYIRTLCAFYERKK